MITLFEKFENKPDVNSLSKEFWKMVRLANWAEVVKVYKENNYSENRKVDDAWEEAKIRIYLKYEYEEVWKFDIEYHTFYMKLYDYFQPIWLDKKYKKIMPGDDGFSDLLSTIIGMGKTFTKMCIEDPDKFIEVAKKDNYIENFGYLLQVNEDEYWKLIQNCDPNNLRLAAKKYNV